MRAYRMCVRLRRLRAHFVAFAGALAIGVVAATSSPDITPSYALNSGMLYRIEVAAAVTVVLYLVVLIGRLAWYGQAPQRFELAGASMDLAPAQAAGEAAVELDAFRAETTEHLQQLDASVEDLYTRLGLGPEAPPRSGTARDEGA
jgi:hypothetical protein